MTKVWRLLFIFLTLNSCSKKNEEEKQENNVEKKYSSLVVPNLSESKLKDMNWELDVKKKEDEKISNSS